MKKIIEPEELRLTPIGVIRTPFKSKYAAPRQPATAPETSVGVITLYEHKNYHQAIEGLRGFDYIWILFWFHKNKNWKPMVLPPNGGRKKYGVFSTRSPHRPNPIGISVCRLLEVNGLTLRVENPDMLDGTPVLDIKPYIPHAESFPQARSGWIEEANQSTLPPFQVIIAPEVRWMLEESGGGAGREALTYVTETLSRDPRPHVYRRIKEMDDGTSMIAVQRWRFLFAVDAATVRVFGISRARSTDDAEE
ncbi:MAG: tRNA (N6-threonylcarbamoyladenosine(37)-N6)-methyltransferase TrmO [Ignavibacteriales bacterium]|nr:tRNA (N6-threonylcarbamoyladenosine(37)-N6)-methyltransferase TrmO [Ignavibacteriales bacterium]